MSEIIVEVDADIMELIPGFLNNRKKNLVAIEESMEAKDYEAIYQTAHKIKGSSALYGVADLSGLAKELEFAGRDKDLKKIEEYFNKMKEYLSQLKIESK